VFRPNGATFVLNRLKDLGWIGPIDASDSTDLNLQVPDQALQLRFCGYNYSHERPFDIPVALQKILADSGHYFLRINQLA
jgi:hypothetical protein